MGPAKHRTPNLESQLHSEALNAARAYRKSEIELIEVLERVDRAKLFYKMGYSSLFTYTTQALGLSNEVAYIYIRVARKTQEVPELKEEIKSGSITVSKAKKICSVLTKENQKSWLNLAKTESTARIERSVAMSSPKLAIREKLEFVHPSLEVKESVKIKRIESVEVVPRIQLQVGVSEKLMLKVRRAQEVLSQKMRRPVSLEETLAAMAEGFLAKNDPIEKAKRQSMRGGSLKNSRVAKSAAASSNRKVEESRALPINGEATESEARQVIRPRRGALPQKTKHFLNLKSKGRWSYQDQLGNRCNERRFLEIHHLVPISKGGGDNIENLTVVCSGHHKMIHHG